MQSNTVKIIATSSLAVIVSLFPSGPAFALPKEIRSSCQYPIKTISAMVADQVATNSRFSSPKVTFKIRTASKVLPTTLTGQDVKGYVEGPDANGEIKINGPLQIGALCPNKEFEVVFVLKGIATGTINKVVATSSVKVTVPGYFK